MRSRGPLALAVVSLARRPAFAASVALTLGLGVGANVAVFTLVDAALLRALPYPEADRLVLAWEARPDRGWSRFGVSAPAFRDWRGQVPSLERIVAFYESQANVAGPAGPERVNVLHATADLLPALGLRPRLGRGLEPGDERPQAPAALLGFGLWQRAFGGDAGVLGRSLRVGRESVTVVGVLPPEVGVPFASPSLVRPLALDDDTQRGSRWLTVLGRVAPGRTEAQARAELEALAVRRASEWPDTNAGWTVTVVGLPEAARESGRLALLLLSAVVGLLLLLTCANVTHLLLVRTLGRERELAIRAALGAGPWGLVQPVLAEALALVALGAGAGLALAALAVRLLRSAGPALASPTPALDGRALAAGLAVTALTAALVALLPAAHARRAAATAALRAGGSSHLTPQRRRLRRALVVAELVLERLRGLPGVVAVAAVNRLPLTGGWWVMGFEVEGRPPSAPGEDRSAFGRVVTPGYFGAMGVALRSGRDFDARDSSRGRGVVIVDETLARREFGERSPLGAVLRIDGETEATIVGVAAATRMAGLDRPPSPAFYVPLEQARFGFYPDWGMDVVVRAAGDPRPLAPLVRSVLRELDPTLPAFAVRTLDELVEGGLGTRRTLLRVLGGFSLLALLLAAVGLYGVLAQLARERAREFGVRLALGARPGEVGALVLGEGLRLAALGAALGLAFALAAGGALRGVLYGVPPQDPVALAVAAGLMLATAAAASLPTALRTVRLDAAQILRDE